MFEPSTSRFQASRFLPCRRGATIHSKAWAEFFPAKMTGTADAWTEILMLGRNWPPGPTRRIPLNEHHALRDFRLLIRDAEQLENEAWRHGAIDPARGAQRNHSSRTNSLLFQPSKIPIVPSLLRCIQRSLPFKMTQTFLPIRRATDQRSASCRSIQRCFLICAFFAEARMYFSVIGERSLGPIMTSMIAKADDLAA